MHQPVRDNLEDYLNRRSDALLEKTLLENKMPEDMAAHLAACAACANEFEQLKRQSDLLKTSLRVPECEPRPGFYARVMDRIERQPDNSIWAILLLPNFGRRIAIASAALVVVLGSYLVSSENRSPAPAPQEISQESTLPQQRDAVLVNLASYQQ